MQTKRTKRQVIGVGALAAALGLGLLATGTPASADGRRDDRERRVERNEVRQDIRAWDYKYNRDYRNDRWDGPRDVYRADGWYDRFGVFHYYYDRHR